MAVKNDGSSSTSVAYLQVFQKHLHIAFYCFLVLHVLFVDEKEALYWQQDGNKKIRSFVIEKKPLCWYVGWQQGDEIFCYGKEPLSWYVG